MLTARELRQAGMDVLIVERQQSGRESSWAGGGILSPLYPWRYAEPVTALAAWSQGIYAQLCAQLQAESDIDPQWTRSGLLILGAEDQVAALAWAHSHNITMEAAGASEARAVEPHLGEGLPGGVWLPQVAQVRNPRLVRALRASIERSGVRIMENTAVSRIRVEAAGSRRLPGISLRAALWSRAGPGAVRCSSNWV